MITTVGPDGLSIQLPAPSFAALGPPLGIAFLALCVVGLACTLFVAVTDPQWFWVFGAWFLGGLEGARIGLALLARAVGRERLVVDTKRLRLQRVALGRFGEYVEVSLEDVVSIRRGSLGRVRIETARGAHTCGRGLTDAEATWLARTLSARLPGAAR